MGTAAFVVMLIAAILFAVEFMRSNWQSLLSLGLCLTAVALILQFTTDSRDIIF